MLNSNQKEAVDSLPLWDLKCINNEETYIYLSHLIGDAPIYEKTYGVRSKKNHR